MVLIVLMSVMRFLVSELKSSICIAMREVAKMFAHSGLSNSLRIFFIFDNFTVLGFYIDILIAMHTTVARA